MDYQEYKRDFLEMLRNDSAISGTDTEDEFIDRTLEILSSFDEVEDPVRIGMGDKKGRGGRIMRADGYCFDETGSVKVYSPLSVSRFFRSITESLNDSGCFTHEGAGQDSVLSDFLKAQGVRLSDILSDGQRTVCGEPDFRFPESLLSMNPKVLLCQYGYLTLDSSMRGFNVRLKVPNRQALAALANLAF